MYCGTFLLLPYNSLQFCRLKDHGPSLRFPRTCTQAYMCQWTKDTYTWDSISRERSPRPALRWWRTVEQIDHWTGRAISSLMRTGAQRQFKTDWRLHPWACLAKLSWPFIFGTLITPDSHRKHHIVIVNRQVITSSTQYVRCCQPVHLSLDLFGVDKPYCRYADSGG